MPAPNYSPRNILKHLLGYLFPVTVYGSQEEADKVYPWTPWFFDILEESGYLHMQATKPDTLGE